MKTLTCVAALGAALLMTHSAFAASAVAKACAADIKAQCADVKPGGGKLKDCVKAHFSDLSADCQVAIVRAAAVGRACKADVKQFCADVKPRQGSNCGLHEGACGRRQQWLQGRDGEGRSGQEVA